MLTVLLKKKIVNKLQIQVEYTLEIIRCDTTNI